MTTKFQQPGAILDHTPGSDVSSNDVVAVGDSVGVAMDDIASGKTGPLQIEGVFELAKVSGTAWSQGDKLDWDASQAAFTKNIGTPATGDVTGCAIAAADAASADTTGEVKLTNPGTLN